jgi:poly-gamma-glutamate synthesis protein (capsule biosynthesis protein)
VLLLLVLSVSELPPAEPEPVHAQLLGRRPDITLSFVGDIMHHALNAGMPDYDRLYDSVRRLLWIDDLSFANLEFPIDPAQEPRGYPLFNGSEAYLEAAVRGGIDVFSLANNHTFDLQATGVASTRMVVDSFAVHGVAANGIRPEPGAAIDPAETTVRGWRIGFVSITAFSNVPGSGRYIHLVDYTDPDARADFLTRVTRWSRRYDLLVVGVHAGEEYVPHPDAAKFEFFHDLAGAGADVVWGHHPHVLQPWEMKDGGLIIHSAGNFVSGQRRHQSPWVPVGRWAATGDTAIYQVRVRDSGDSARVTAVRTPLFTMYPSPAHGLVLRAFGEVLTGEMDLSWRAFYLARYAAMRRALAAGRSSAEERPRVVTRP